VAAARTRPDDPYIIGGQRGDHYNIRRARGEELAFHSLRRTVATLLENAGYRKASLRTSWGHEKKTLSYGLYSSGSSMERKREAIEKLVYPGVS
jgi:integrase